MSSLASGIVNTAYQIGSAVGLAVMVALAASATPSSVAAPALLDGFHAAFFEAAVVAFLGAAVALVALRSVPVAREVPARWSKSALARLGCARAASAAIDQRPDLERTLASGLLLAQMYGPAADRK